ncbi:MAG TPA: ribbon-helix-helix domain-containing protein [Alphaproteobacteria bacterium]|nr:ribbon-helix-helix domain-containing protein [Alphaproteobacteria bacterium]
MSTKKHTLTLWGHQTSISLEPEFWEALKEIAAQTNQSLASLVASIDDASSSKEGLLKRNLSSALRVYILKYYKEVVLIKSKER